MLFFVVVILNKITWRLYSQNKSSSFVVSKFKTSRQK